MELQFQKKSLPCMREILSQCREQELTQEVRLPDGMPDIGKVLGTWGQVLVRGKEWRPDSISVSGGLMIWILYKAEDSNECHVVETWLPFHSKWDIPNSPNDGNIMVLERINFSDARSISARKLMLRMGVCFDVQAFVPGDVCIYLPEQLQSDIQIRKNTYPMKLPAEMGEKPFSLEEQIPLPDNAPELEKIIRYSLRPEIVELKVLGGRLVFRGVAVVHILYRCADGMLFSCDVDIPFSQYAELDHEYEEGADASVQPIVTSLELETDENKVLNMKAGLAGQYVIRNREMIEVVEDAYSPECNVDLQFEQFQVPVVLEESVKVIQVERSTQIQAMQSADVEFISQAPERNIDGTGDELQLYGRFYALYYDENNDLQGAHVKWENAEPMDVCNGTQLRARVIPVGKPRISANNQLSLYGQVQLQCECTALQGIRMVSAIVTSEREKQVDSPSLIVRKAGNDDLWTIAKNSGSTIEAICAANGITGELSEDQMLLIPVL